MESLVVEDGKRVITQLGLWEWLKTYRPHSNEGFGLDYHPNLVLIYSELALKPISGTSFGDLMERLHRLALQRDK